MCMEMIHNFLLDKCVLQVTKYTCDLVEKKTHYCHVQNRFAMYYLTLKFFQAVKSLFQLCSNV